MALIRAKIKQIVSEAESGSSQVDLLAVSKGQTYEKILVAAKAGQVHFGENYVQDALPKIAAAKENNLDLSWHFIGQIQSNKTRSIAKYFDWCQSLSSLKHARLIDKHRKELHYNKPIQVCAQVQFEEKQSRGGVQFSEAENFIAELQTLDHLNVRGLMCVMPRMWKDKELTEAYKKLNKLFLRLKEGSNDFDTLSSGMSSDYSLAIQHGSTMVRLGSAIFGSRD